MAWTALASKQQTLGANRFAVSLLLGVFDRPSTTDECNCKNSAQNALKVAIFRLKIEKFSGSPEPVPHWGGGYPLPKPYSRRRLRRLDTRACGARHSAPSEPRSSRLRRSTLAPFCKSWIRHCLSGFQTV